MSDQQTEAALDEQEPVTETSERLAPEPEPVPGVQEVVMDIVPVQTAIGVARDECERCHKRVTFPDGPLLVALAQTGRVAGAVNCRCGMPMTLLLPERRRVQVAGKPRIVMPR